MKYKHSNSVAVHETVSDGFQKGQRQVDEVGPKIACLTSKQLTKICDISEDGQNRILDYSTIFWNAFPNQIPDIFGESESF